MAKKRVRRSKARPVKKVKTARRVLPPVSKAFYVADVLATIAVFFLILNAALIFIFADKIVSIALTYGGISTDKATWLLLGTSWLFLALFTYMINRYVRYTAHRASMWFLLLIGIAALPAGRLESAVLIIVSAAIYLMKGKSK